ncbi:MAG: hypothetical protein WBW71_13760 [Bacteroidota bacterium]
MNTNTSFKKWLALILIGTIAGGCSYNETVTRRSELADPIKTGEISVMTKDKTVFRLENYKLIDSAIVGTGSLDDGIKKVSFSGTIPFSNIEYIQVRKSSVLEGIVAGGAIAIFGITAIEALGENHGLSVTPVITNHNIGGSCPFIYSWDGKGYCIEGEAIGVAWGKALELNTCTVLHSFNMDDNAVRIRVSNERPETHYLNSVNLVGVEADASAFVCVDEQKKFWPVHECMPPDRAYDQTGGDITTALRSNDGVYWESNISARTGDSRFYDTVEVVFAKPAFKQTASFVVHAINTRIFDAVIRLMGQILGDQSLAFVDAIEHDPEMIAVLKHWLEESNLKAFVWDGRQWNPMGELKPEANEVAFSKVIRFTAPDVKGDSIRIRLTSLSDVWKLDAVGIDWSAAQPLAPQPVNIISAAGTNGKDFRKTLASDDGDYAVLLPGERIDFTFQPLHPGNGKVITYALNVGGYLHEWFPRESNSSRDAERTPQFALVSEMSSKAKISFLKALLREEPVFLPLLYSEWQRQKGIVK